MLEGPVTLKGSYGGLFLIYKEGKWISHTLHMNNKSIYWRARG